MSRWAKLAALLLAALLLCACSVLPEESVGTPVYYLASDPVARELFRLEAEHIPLSGETAVEQAGAVISAMRNPGAENHSSAIPEGVSVLSVRDSGSMLRIELSHEYAALDSGSKSIAAAAIAMSLLDLPDVQYVAITSSGESQAPYYLSYYTRSNLFIDDSLLITDVR